MTTTPSRLSTLVSLTSWMRIRLRVWKGTLLYMSPGADPAEEAFAAFRRVAAAVVCFVALTRRHPFEGVAARKLRTRLSIVSRRRRRTLILPIGPALSQVIHKAMAKQPFQRFGSARDFSENLQKALRNEPIECFNPERDRGACPTREKGI